MRRWGKNKVCRKPVWIPISILQCFVRSKPFSDENSNENSQKPRVFFLKFFPIEILFFKIILESAQIAHSNGNFMLKNFIRRDFFKNKKVRRYDFISHFIHVWRLKIFKNWLMTSYLLPCLLYQTIHKGKAFQYEIFDRMKYFWAIYDNFENFRIIQFQCERVLRKTWTFTSFHQLLRVFLNKTD